MGAKNKATPTSNNVLEPQSHTHNTMPHPPQQGHTHHANDWLSSAVRDEDIHAVAVVKRRVSPCRLLAVDPRILGGGGGGGGQIEKRTGDPKDN